MSLPYAAPLITKLLRKMPDDALRTVRAVDFQRWPAPKIERANLIRELISNERYRRQA